MRFGRMWKWRKCGWRLRIGRLWGRRWKSVWLQQRWFEGSSGDLAAIASPAAAATTSADCGRFSGAKHRVSQCTWRSRGAAEVRWTAGDSATCRDTSATSPTHRKWHCTSDDCAWQFNWRECSSAGPSSGDSDRSRCCLCPTCARTSGTSNACRSGTGGCSSSSICSRSARSDFKRLGHCAEAIECTALSPFDM